MDTTTFIPSSKDQGGRAASGTRKAMLRERMLEPELLRAFVAVVECGGYTAAANYLHRTQAAISQQLGRLEDSTSAVLFQGSKRHLKLTEEGQVLLDYARRLLALNSEAMERIRPDAVGGVVRMGATNYYATLVLPALLTEFSRRHPSIQIDLEVGTAEDMQRKLGPRFDLTINAFQGGQGNGVLLHRDPVVWATATRGEAERKDPLPLALLPQGSLLRRWAEQTLAGAGRRWVLVQESSSVDVLKASVLAGLAVGVFQKATAKQLVELRVLGPEEGFPPLPSTEMWLECANRELPRAAKCLHQFLLEQLTPWPAGDLPPARINP